MTDSLPEEEIDRPPPLPPRTVNLADLLSAQETAELVGLSSSYVRVLLVRGSFPPPVRAAPNLWLRSDVERWKAQRENRS